MQCGAVDRKEQSGNQNLHQVLQQLVDQVSIRVGVGIKLVERGLTFVMLKVRRRSESLLRRIGKKVGFKPVFFTMQWMIKKHATIRFLKIVNQMWTQFNKNARGPNGRK